MRDIKFRAWNGNKMLYEVGSDAWGNPMIYEKNVDVGPVNIDMWIAHEGEVMQFTGLRDKNNKEVFEGDIVRQNGYWICKVIFFEGAYCFEVLNHKKKGTIHHSQNTTLEVIGNIYEHPTLLEPNPTVL